MGNVQDYHEFLMKNYKKYTSYDNFVYGIEETADFSSFAAGSATGNTHSKLGISIQRLFEIASIDSEIPFEMKEFFFYEVFLNFRNCKLVL